MAKKTTKKTSQVISVEETNPGAFNLNTVVEEMAKTMLQHGAQEGSMEAELDGPLGGWILKMTLNAPE